MKATKSTKTFVFNHKGEFLLARPTREFAVRSARRVTSEPLFFTEEDVKKGRHTRFFKKLKAYSSAL